jgi:hypothetical protein
MLLLLLFLFAMIELTNWNWQSRAPIIRWLKYRRVG